MNSHQLFDDLISVPGVHGAILFQPKEAPQRFWLQESDWAQPGDKFLRGAGQMIRRLCDTHDRIELRYLKGRFIIQSLAGGAAVGCFTDKELNLPLLNLTLDEIAQSVEAGWESLPAANQIANTVVSISSTTPAQVAPAGALVSVPPATPELPSAPVLQEPVAEPLPARTESAAQFFNEPSTSQVENFSASNDLLELESHDADAVQNPLNFLAEEDDQPELMEISSQAVEAIHTPIEEIVEEQEELAPLSSHGGIAAGLSDLSMIAMGYLGRSLVIGCWRQTQPADLQGVFHISLDGVIEADNDLAPGDDNTIRLARDWAQSFVSRCNLVTIDLPLHLVAPLNADAQSLLTASASFADRGVIILQHDYLSRMLSGNRQP